MHDRDQLEPPGIGRETRIARCELATDRARLSARGMDPVRHRTFLFL
jgi:hypothetical protein